MGCVMLALTGCEKKPEVPSYAPESYMKDPVFREKLATKRKELQRIVMERQPLMDRMQELVREHNNDLAVLQTIREWNDLHEKVTALNAKYEELRKRQLSIVRGRLTPPRAKASGGDAASPEKISK